MLLRVKPSSGLQITRIVKSGSMKLDLQALAWSIFTICSEKCISIDIQWIPRSENTKADYISKIVDHEDWGSHMNFLNSLTTCGFLIRLIYLLTLGTPYV